MKIILIIGFVIALLLLAFALMLYLAKIDMVDYINNRPKGKSKNAERKLKKLNLFMKFIWLSSMILLGIVSYMWGRYVIIG